MRAIDASPAARHSASAMAAPRTPAQTIALLKRETRLREGRVPPTIGDYPLRRDSHVFGGGQFGLRTDSGYAFHYVPGEGVTIERAVHADPAEQELWLNGSVYAAIACLNGLYPLHASAVAHDGRVHAFTGPSGAGKSTLVAGLGQRGLPLFCDDTMLLDLSDPDHVIALPGHKRLKLTDAALALTGAKPQAPVGAGVDKSYALPPGGAIGEPLPLAQLVFLETIAAARFEPLRGAERFARLGDDHYTQDFYAIARRPTQADLFALRARLARQVAMARLARPISAEGFAISLDLAESAVRSFGGENAV
ncbi:MAG: hypothetical protein JSR28_18315 [Proteobacteria bacterium]|nr:hypothetical protein [Pseudomonadota bacterium]